MNDDEFHDHYLDLPVETHGIVLQRDGGRVSTNVPHLVTHHSPDGYEWGYGGSGPADLALNICELALIRLGYHGPRIDCYDGDCFELAWLLHQECKRRFVAPADRGGDVISWNDVYSWMAERAGYRQAEQ